MMYLMLLETFYLKVVAGPKGEPKISLKSIIFYRPLNLRCSTFDGKKKNSHRP